MPSYAAFSMTLPATPEIQRRCMERIAARYRHIVRLPAPDAVHARPRIGYIGAKLDAEHVSGTLFTHLFPHHDFSEFDVYVFLTNENGLNHNQQRLDDCPHLTVVDLSDYEDCKDAANRIRDLGIDVLISTDGWNDEPRPAIMAYHPAHIQVWWQGTATTSGAPWMDYIVTDKYIDSQKAGWRSEKALMMPDCYYVAGHVNNELVPPTPSRVTAQLPTDMFLFSAMCDIRKLNPETWEVWMRILQACPNSALVLLSQDKMVIMRLQNIARDYGIESERLIFLPYVSPWDHIARAGMFDLYLDTFYVGAHTTFAESLWMNVPGITLIGETMSSRVAYSMLNSVDMSVLAVRTREQYKELAIQLYEHPELLKLDKAKLERTKATSSLFNMRKQAETIEAFVKEQIALRK